MPNTPTLILGYHNVMPTAAFGGDAAGLPAFREQLRTIARRCAVVPFGRGEVHNPTRRPTVALTFDDGYRDNATLVAELLDELGLPATFYLVTGFLDGTDYPWWEVVATLCAHPGVSSLEAGGRAYPLASSEARAQARRELEQAGTAADLAARDLWLEELRASAGAAGAEAVAEAKDRTPMMSWADAKELAAAGFSIGSHTARHAIVAREGSTVLSSQLEESKHRLQDELGVEVTTFAYPRGAAGDFDDDAVRLVRQAGYRHAVTTIPGLNVAGTMPLRLRRLVLEPAMGTSMLLRAVATQLGGAAARAVFSLAPASRRAARTPRPSA